MSNHSRVIFDPIGRRITRPTGSSLLEAARQAGVPITSVCGGKGTCGKCQVRASGALSPITTQEREHLSADEIQAGHRLACQALVQGPVVVQVHPTEAIAYKPPPPTLEARYGLDPNVRKVYLHLPRPSLEDQRSDLDRLREALDVPLVAADLPALRDLPNVARGAGWHLTAVLVGGQLVAAEGGDTSDKAYGIAFDLGTTTAAAYLLDLNAGQQLAAAVATNHQTVYGDDVISRIDHARGKGLAALQQAALDTLNFLVEQVCREAEADPNNIYEAVLVGNTCMAQLFLGIDPYPIAVAPYVPVLGEAVDVPARALDLAIAEGANVHVLPAVAGYVGADAVADVLATSLGEDGRVRVVMDIGTNAEIILSTGKRMLACAAAAGPAFEGARISCGMRAGPGAIDRVEIANDRVELHTLGDRPPLGLAGSGLVSAAAALRRHGLLGPRGHFVTNAAPAGLFSPAEEGPEFRLVSPDASGTGKAIGLSQRDITELLLAKAAIAAGLKTLLKEAGLAVDDIEEVLIAGSFGNYVDKQAAIDIGLVPPLAPERVKGIGNAAGAGAILALLSLEGRQRAQEIARNLEYVELSACPDFKKEFVRGMVFPSIVER